MRGQKRLNLHNTKQTQYQQNQYKYYTNKTKQPTKRPSTLAINHNLTHLTPTSTKRRPCCTPHRHRTPHRNQRTNSRPKTRLPNSTTTRRQTTTTNPTPMLYSLHNSSPETLTSIRFCSSPLQYSQVYVFVLHPCKTH